MGMHPDNINATPREVLESFLKQRRESQRSHREAAKKLRAEADYEDSRAARHDAPLAQIEQAIAALPGAAPSPAPFTIEAHENLMEHLRKTEPKFVGTHVARPYRVHARKITDIPGNTPGGGLNLTLEDGSPYTAGTEMTLRHFPVVGDYLVIGEDGYAYLNPAEVFERKFQPRMKFTLPETPGFVPLTSGQDAPVQILDDTADAEVDPDFQEVKPCDCASGPTTVGEALLEEARAAGPGDVVATNAEGVDVSVAPKVTMADIESSIAGEYFFTALDGVHGAEAAMIANVEEIAALRMTTFCVLVMKNGARVVGVNYGTVDPRNHSAEDGKKYSRATAIERCWELFGYALKDRLYRGNPL